MRRGPFAAHLLAPLLPALLAAGWPSSRVHAEPSPLHLSGEASAGVWSSDRSLDDRGARASQALELTARLDPAPAWRLQAQATGWRLGRSARARWREAFVQWSGERTDVRLGPQVIAWGRGDRINPTDNLSPKDFVAPWVDDDRQRFGATALQVGHDFGTLGRASLVVERFRPGVAPNDANEAALPWRHDESRTTHALKWDRTGEAVDASVSWFRGSEALRSLQIVRDPASARGLNRGYATMSALGGDAAATVGRWGLRFEAARLRFPQARFEQTAGRLDHWFGVAGIDTHLGDEGTLGLQYFVRRFDRDPRGPVASPTEAAWRAQAAVANNQLHRRQDGLTLRWAQRLWNGSVDYELVAVLGLQDGDRALRPRWTWHCNDSLRLVLGADLFGGPRDSFFGSLRRNSAGWAQASLVF